MIKNDQQLSVTTAKRERLHAAITALGSRRNADILVDAEARSMEADMRQLDREIAEYQAVSAGEFDAGNLKAVSDFGEGLVKARIAAGLTQGQLAKELGFKAQQIQRYERTLYESANLKTIDRVATALFSILKIARQKGDRYRAQ